ncbi:MAG: hypothetical protein ACHQ53_07900 [Polyangiales bacterium]
MKLDSERTVLTLRTGVEGLFAAVAHSLELRAQGVTGEVQGARGTVCVPVAGLRVVGALTHGRVDPEAPSPADKAEIERRIRETVLVGAHEVTVEVALSGSRATFTVHAPHGTQVVSCAIERSDLQVRGRCSVSLQALGVAQVKLPLGAARVSDAVEVLFEAALLQ